MRRSPDAILTAHEMDPSRRELYVEGPTDAKFINWITINDASIDSLVIEISYVDMPNIEEGGNRGRLIEFAKAVEGAPAAIKIFADADYDRILGHDAELPPNTWLSDGKDLEAYFLHEECFEKITRLAIGTEEYTGAQLLAWLTKECRILGFLRLLSEVNGLDLPFQRTQLRRYVSFDLAGFCVDLRSYVAALLSNCARSRREVSGLIDTLLSLQTLHSSLEDSQIIHGKDAVELLGEALLHHRIDRTSSLAILRVSFDCALVDEYPILRQVIDYVIGIQ